MKFCILASGSAGNAAFLSSGETRILIDAGLNVKQLKSRLADIGEDLSKIDAVVISHDHGDHVAALPVMAKPRSGIRCRFYLPAATAAAIQWGGRAPDRVETFQPGDRFEIEDIAVQTFAVPHDAADPCGFRFTADGVQVATATDLGYLGEAVRAHLKLADVLLLESNYDAAMLRCSPYPASVRLRIASRTGHLDNAESIDFLTRDLGSNCRALILGHLSCHNNHAAIVENGAYQALEIAGLSPKVWIAQQDRVGEAITL